MSSTVVSVPNGIRVPVDDLPQTFTWVTLPDGSQRIHTATVIYANLTFIQTFNYSGNVVSGVSAWVQQ